MLGLAKWLDPARLQIIRTHNRIVTRSTDKTRLLAIMRTPVRMVHDARCE